MTMKALEKVLKMSLTVGLVTFLITPYGVFAQEYDDLYFSSKDRKEKKGKGS